MRRELVDIRGRDADPGDLINLAAFVEAETEQETAAGGIVVGVGLRNGGANELPLLNPFELLQFHLRDEHGYPVLIPTKPPNLLVHRPAGHEWRLDSPLPIVAVRRNGQAADASTLDTEIFRVDGGEECRVSFVIDRYLSGSEADGNDAIPAAIRLPDGIYGVRVLATLIHAEQRQHSRIVESDEIEVRYRARA